MKEPNFLTLRAVLEGAKPSIWRRIRIDDSMTFYQLHLALQCVMGWENYHLYCFNIGENITIEDYDEKELGPFNGNQELLNPFETKISDLIKKVGDTLLYTYDFGDNWTIKMKVQSISPLDMWQNRVSCLSGKRSGPPEDSGGIWQYQNSLEILKNKKHPQYKEISQWMHFSSEFFDLKEVNERLYLLNIME